MIGLDLFFKYIINILIYNLEKRSMIELKNVMPYHFCNITNLQTKNNTQKEHSVFDILH